MAGENYCPDSSLLAWGAHLLGTEGGRMDRIRATVTGPNEVAGVAPGGTVELDPELVNVAALVEGGHVQLTKAAAKVVEADA